MKNLCREFSKKLLAVFHGAAFLAVASAAQAHHSFPVHFVPEGEVTVTGVVDSFRFSNPHGVLEFTVMNAGGEKVAWRAETNSPSVLRRRGWSKESLKPGQEVTVTGWPARKDEHYMRIMSVTFSDGSVLATQRGATLEQD